MNFAEPLVKNTARGNPLSCAAHLNSAQAKCNRVAQGPGSSPKGVRTSGL